VNNNKIVGGIAISGAIFIILLFGGLMMEETQNAVDISEDWQTNGIIGSLLLSPLIVKIILSLIGGIVAFLAVPDE